VKSVQDVRRIPHRLAGFAPDVASTSRELKRFLKLNLYDTPAIVEDRDRGVQALDELVRYYMKHPDAMPPFYASEAIASRVPSASRGTSPSSPASSGGRAPHLVVCDYVAGMTDHFLLRTHRELIGR
jgi:dGTPase